MDEPQNLVQVKTVLEVRDAVKRFREVDALAGAGFGLRRGEWLGLLGPNGAGKTTLVRALAGRVRLDEGSMMLLGNSLTGEPAGENGVRKRMGVVPQDIALYPLLTARENLQNFGALQGLSGQDLQERAEWALEWTGLADRAGELVKGFSGGMKRRLNIACSVLHRPEVILLDEPTVGVDPQSRQRIWEMLEALRGDGASLLLTTHQLDEAQQVCDRIVILDHGKTIAEGTFRELVAKTIGSTRQMIVEVERSPESPKSPNTLAPLEACGWSVKGCTLEHDLDEVAEELPGLLGEVKEAGGTIVDIHLKAPTLQSVFIHLTGEELRE